MNARRSIRRLPLMVVVTGISTLGLPLTTPAATEQFWNPGGAGGDGIWGTSPGDKNWNLTSGAPAGNTFWPNTLDDIAVFQNSVGGIVTVFDPVLTTGIIQREADYSINAGSIVLARDSADTAPFIRVQSGTLSIDSTLEGSDGLSKSGNGDLVVSAANSYTGPTIVRQGNLSLTGSLASTKLDIADGASLRNESGGLPDNAIVTNNAGTLTINAPEEIASYQSIGGLLNGSEPLTVTGTATLSGGEVAGTLLGDIICVDDDPATPDVVEISGTTGNGTLTVMSGTLNLTGTANNPLVDIQGGDLILSGDNIADTSNLNIASGGSVDIYGNETVATASIAGTVHGLRTLSAATYTLRDGAVINGNLGEGGIAIEPGSTVAINGTLASDTITVSGSTLILSGDNLESTTSMGTDLGGILQLNGDQTVDTFDLSSGVLSGDGTLRVTNGATIGPDAEVSGNLSGDISVRAVGSGAAQVTGSIGGGTLDVAAGTLILSGSSANTPVTIADSGTLYDQNGGLDTTATVTNAGQLTLEQADTIASYTSNAGRLGGPGTLTVTDGAALNDGSMITGTLDADITTHGNVLVSGVISGGSLRVADGTLTLTGSSTSTPVTILGGAALVDAGDLADSAHIVNGGTLTVDVADTVRSYLSDGGLLDGTGTLITTGTSILNGSSTVAGTLAALGGATLNNLSTITGLLTGDTTMNDFSSVGPTGVIQGHLTSTGDDVTIAGLTEGGHLDVTAGMLTVTGSAFNPLVTIRSGATVIDQSTNAFLDTAELTNRGVLVLNGSETVGSYHNSPAGTLQVTVDGPVLHDRLVADALTLAPGSSLTLARTELLLGQVADIIDGAIDGTFARIEALTGTGKDLRYAFNPNNGSIQALPGRPLPTEKPSDTLYNLSANQTQVIGTAFDDTYLDPATTPGMDTIGNFRRIYYRDTGNPDPAQRWQEIQPWQGRPGDTYAYDLDPGLGRAPVAPGSQAALLGDAITLFQASYDVLRDETGAPVLDAAGNPIPIVTAPGLAIANALSPQVHQGMADFTRQAMRSQLRTAMRTAPMATAGKGSMFAAIHSTSAGSDGGADGASYDIDMEGAVAGLRYEFVPNLQVGAMLGMLGGDIKGSHIDTDGKGIMFGLFGEYLLAPATRTILSSSLAYGSYEYDAKRRSFGGSVFANDIDSDAWEFAIGIESVVYQTDRFRVIPRGAMRYLNGDVDGFKEQGQGVRMDVNSIKTTSLLLELGVDAEFDVNECFTLRAHLGGLTDLKGSGGYVSGSYLGGGLPVGVSAPGIDGEAFIFGLGGSYELNEATRFDLNWRSEVRDGSQNTHLFSLGTRVTF